MTSCCAVAPDDFGPVIEHLDRICELLADCRRDMLAEHPRDEFRGRLLAEALTILWSVRREVVVEFRP